MSGHIRKLVDHLRWADRAVIDALRTTPGSDARALVIYAHIIGTESVWLARIAGRPSDVAVWPTLSLDDVGALAERNARELDALAARASADDLARLVHYRNSDGDAFSNTLEDIMLHIALHGTYHRGQVALLIRAGGGEPASTDFIAFIRGAPAARSTPPIPIA